MHSSFSKIALHLLVYGERKQKICGKTGPFSPLEESSCKTGCLVWPTIDNQIQNTYENSSSCHTCKLSCTCVLCVPWKFMSQLHKGIKMKGRLG